MQSSSYIEKPEMLRHIMLLLWTNMGLGFIGSAVSLISNATPIMKQMPGLIFFSMLLGYSLIFFINNKISQGRNWARVLFLIFFSFGVVIMAFTIKSTFHPYSGWRLYFRAFITAASTILQAVAFVMLFNRDVVRYFKRNKKVTANDQPWT